MKSRTRKKTAGKNASEAKTSKASGKRALRGARESPEAGGRTAPVSFSIVGVGASAGGLEAFTDLLTHLPTDTGMGFVLVQHLDLQHESAIPQLLPQTTFMTLKRHPDSVGGRTAGKLVARASRTVALLECS